MLLVRLNWYELDSSINFTIINIMALDFDSKTYKFNTKKFEFLPLCSTESFQKIRVSNCDIIIHFLYYEFCWFGCVFLICVLMCQNHYLAIFLLLFVSFSTVVFFSPIARKKSIIREILYFELYYLFVVLF